MPRPARLDIFVFCEIYSYFAKYISQNNELEITSRFARQIFGRFRYDIPPRLLGIRGGYRCFVPYGRKARGNYFSKSLVTVYIRHIGTEVIKAGEDCGEYHKAHKDVRENVVFREERNQRLD